MLKVLRPCKHTSRQREKGKTTYIENKPDWNWIGDTSSSGVGMWRVLRVLLADGGLLASPDNREKDRLEEIKTRARSIMPSLEKKRKGW